MMPFGFIRFWLHVISWRNQLAQSVLKIGSALAERMGQGEVGGYTTLPDSAWWWLQLPVDRHAKVERLRCWSHE